MSGSHRSIASPWRRIWSAFGAVVLLWLGLSGPAAAYDKWITTNPWLVASAEFHPASCSSNLPPSGYLQIAAGDGRYGFPEEAREQALSYGNANCLGSIGACSRITSWASSGPCELTGAGSPAGSGKCPYLGNVVTQKFTANGCEGPEVGSTLNTFVQIGKHCQAISSYGLFDVETRQCYCSSGVFVPEKGICSQEVDSLWMPHCDLCKGNPIYPPIGAKVQHFQLGWQPWYGLRATFNSMRRVPFDPDYKNSYAPDDPTTLGGAWTTNLDQSTFITAPAYLNVDKGGGSRVAFKVVGGVRVPVNPQSSDTIVSLPGPFWYYRQANDGRASLFEDSTGRLRGIYSIDGKWMKVVRSDANTPPAIAPQAGLPIEVTDQDGRVIKLRYAMSSPTGVPVLTQVIDPAANVTTVRYAGSIAGPSELVSSDQTSTKLLYENAGLPWALTGYLNENGTRAGTYSYDTEGRVTGTERANGLDAYRVSWDMPPRWIWQSWYDTQYQKVVRLHMLLPGVATVTYPNGQTETVQSTATVGNVQWASKAQQAGAGSGAAVTSRDFDDRGNVIRWDDYNGNRSCMSYDLSRSVELSRIEGLGVATSCASIASGPLPAGARKVSTQWHPMWALATKTAEPSRLTTLVYNGQPDPFNGNAIASCERSGTTLPDGSVLVLLCKRVEQATTDATGEQGFNATPLAGVAARTWSWTYTPTGQVLTEKGPLGTTTVTNEYYATTTADYTKNDLKSTINAAGHKTSFVRYNAYGQPLEAIDANAASTTYAYDGRQRVKTVTTAGATTTFDYWPTGELKRTLQADGSAVNYEYDDARRLIAVADSRGNRIEYTLDAEGKRTKEDAKDPLGALKRTMSRAFDALGRAQQTTGRE